MLITCRIATPSSSLPLKTLWNLPHSMGLFHRPLLTLPPLQLSPLSPIASVAVLVNVTISESLLATFMSLVADPVPGNHSRLRLAVHHHRGVRLPGGHCRLVGPLRLLRGEAPPVEPLRLLRDEPHRKEPLRLLKGLPPAGPLRLRGESPPRGCLHLGVFLRILLIALRLQEDLSRGVLNHRRGHLGTPSLQGEAPLLQSDNVGRRETLSPLQLNTLPGPPLGSLHKRGQGQGLLRSKLPLPERRRKLTMLQFRPLLRPWSSLSDQTFQMPSPLRLRSPPGLSTCLPRSASLIQRVSFVDTQKKFSKRIQEGRACHTLLPSLHRLEKVANSPSQGKELIANPDVLDLLKNKVPDFRHLPISVKEGMALERTLRSIMESQSFLTWSVMGLVKSLHLKNLLPKDDPVISQMQKSFSKACSNVASGMTAGAAFLTMKRRQLLLSHVVPSVSEAQKRNLLADPFFQTSSLFDASSLESARSAARDMSLFKPHLKASTSSSQGRRQGPSTASSRRGSARQYSGPSSSQRASSPFRQQSAKKGDARFHKKSSGTPQKRGGFRK